MYFQYLHPNIHFLKGGCNRWNIDPCPQELPATRPPTYQDLVNYRAFLLNKDTNYKVPGTLYSKMAPDILSKWDKISPNLELKSEQQVSDMVRRFFDNYIKVKGKCANYKTRLKYLAPKLKTVMDVTKCTCKLQFRVDCDEKTCQTNAALVKMTNRGEESTAHQHVKCLCFKLLPLA